MAGQPAPITPPVLRWALEEDGRTFVEIADAMRVDEAVLEAWATGDQVPTKGQVTELARALRRPRALFFLPEPPVQNSAPARFRRPPGSTRSATPAALRVFRRAVRVQRAVAWARGDEVVDLPLATLGTAPDQAAARVRAWLGVTDAEQGRWRNDREALRAWRDALDERDILAFQLEIGADEVRGFSAWDPAAPMIAMNLNRVSPSARVFTLGHELGHLVLRLDAACVDEAVGPRPIRGASENDALERWCEAFSGALTMPAEQIRAVMAALRIGRGDADVDEVKAVAARFRVSHRAAALRLIDLGWAERRLYVVVLSEFKPKPPSESKKDQFGRMPRATNRVREFGPSTLRTVLTSMPELDAMSVLRIDATDVRQLADQVPGVRAS